uniref:Uncharacterized protein n=1 Tax=Percursaria percursa TaxID=153906 RepID=A0A8K1JCC1_9CHLO|nr:hypothetical protein [Percursaria percursa]
MTTPILLEIYYRSFYIASVFVFVQCFSYFTQGFQLEFFSGLFVTNFQAVDFNFYNDIKHSPFLLKEVQLLSFIMPIEGFLHFCFLKTIFLTFFCAVMALIEFSQKTLICFLYNTIDDFIVLSSNEAKTWSCLFIVYLNYFYCIGLNKSVLNFLLFHAKLVYLVGFLFHHCFSLIKPGLLKKQNLLCLQALVLFLLLFIVNQCTILMLIATFEEFKLEQLDSELI